MERMGVLERDNTMKMSAIYNYVDLAIENKEVFSIIGDPGIGKTSVIRQICKVRGHKLIEIHAIEWDAVDLKGFPVIIDDIPRFVPYGEMKEILTGSDQTIVVLFDDWGHGSPEMQRGIMQVFRGGLGMNKLPENVVICGASNATMKDGVRGAIGPFKSSQVLVEAEFEHDAFMKYIARENWHVGLQRILQFNPDICHEPTESTSMDKNANPREWERVNRNISILEKSMDSGRISKSEKHDMEYGIYKGCVGHSAAIVAVSQLQIIRELPDPIAFINEPRVDQLPDVNTAQSALYILTETLGNLFDKPEFQTDQLRNNFWTFVGWLPDVFKRLAIGIVVEKDSTFKTMAPMQDYRVLMAQDMTVI